MKLSKQIITVSAMVIDARDFLRQFLEKYHCLIPETCSQFLFRPWDLLSNGMGSYRNSKLKICSSKNFYLQFLVLILHN